MMSLEEYKNSLISLYKYEYDNGILKENERRNILEQNYSDEYLQKIVDDSNSFIKQIIDLREYENGSCEFPLENDTTSYIFLNLVDGSPSDTLFTDLDGRIISKNILKKSFGYLFNFFVKVNLIPEEREDNTLSYYYKYCLYMQGFVSDLTPRKLLKLN